MLLTLLTLYITIVIADLEVYTGDEPIESTSPIFNILLTQNNITLSPHVYWTKSNSTNYNSTISHLQDVFYNRSVSWIEFGQKMNDKSIITVTLKPKYSYLFNNSISNNYSIKIFPSSYNIQINIINTTTIQFQVYSHFKSLSLEYGYCNASNNINLCNESSFKNSLLIFIGDLSPQINKSDPNILYFSSGVHNITNPNNGNGGLLYLNKSTIYFERGSFVYGKILCINNNYNYCNIIGYGILSGDKFSYINRFHDEMDYRAMINITHNIAVNLTGLTIINPSQYSIVNLPNKSIIKSYKLIAWYYNNDGIGFTGNGIITYSFIRTNDDSIKMQYNTNNIAVNNTIWQLFNGACFQFGWQGNGCSQCIIDNINIIHTEWRGNYKGDTSNNAIININSPYFNDGYMNRIYQNNIIQNIAIDSFIGRFIGIRFNNILNANVYLINWEIENITFLQNEQWFCQNGYGPQFLNISNSTANNTYIKNIHFHQIFSENIQILSNEQWNLQINDQNSDSIQNITYS